MPTKKVARKAKQEQVTPHALVLQFRTWVGIKTTGEELKKQQETLRKWLLSALEDQGEPDDKGNLYLELPEEIEGYATLKAERRVTQNLNEEKAEELVVTKGIKDRCTSLVVRVTDHAAAVEALRAAGLLDMEGFHVDAFLDEEEILKAHYEGLITQEELDSIFDTKENFAFKPLQG